MLQAQFKSVGVEMRIRQIELSSFLAVVQGPARDFDAALIGVTGDLSLGYIRALYDSPAPGPLAYSGYRSVSLDSALADVQTATSETQLARAWRRVQDILGRDHPTSWLYHARGLQGVNRRIESVTIDLRGELANVTRWTITKEGASR
jgi:ABC-type transport system substrate-binding protein